MKKIYIIAAMAVLSLWSCDDFLTKYPEDKIVSDDFFKSEREIDLYANSMYVKDFPGTSIALSDGISDITAVMAVSSYLTNGYTSSSQGGWSWSDLTNINFFIEKVTSAPVSQDVKDKYLGLARFWRAKFYFEKVKTFGDVPFYDTYLQPDSEELYKPRDARTLVMDKVLEDLNFAIENCQESDATGTIITRYVAMALKSRVCLFEGTFRKYHNEMGLPDADKWLDEAAKVSYDLMQSGAYSLHNTGNPESDYRDLFIATGMDGVKEVLDEVIWAQVYDESLTRWHNVTWKYNSATYGSRWSLTKEFINTYLNADGSRFTETNADPFSVPFQKEVTGRDLRLKQTIRTTDYHRADGSKALPDFNITLTGYQILKWSLDDSYFDGRGEATNAMPIFRYAEILLNYAEAKAELGEFNSTVWDQTIKPLRERAGVNGKEPTAADSYLQDNFYEGISDKYLLEIRRERTIEFIAENFRYDDLVRWKLGNHLDKSVSTWSGIYVPQVNVPFDIDGDNLPDVCFYNTASKPSSTAGVVYYKLSGNLSLSGSTSGNLVWGDSFTRVWEDKKYIHPVPFSAITKNPALSQNDDWE